MKTLFFLIALILIPITAQAVFLRCDAYTVAETSAELRFSGTLNGEGFDVPAFVDTDGTGYLKLDVTGKAQGGLIAGTVKAYNLWGESPTVNFSLPAVAPGRGPLNVRAVK